jgi:hypothetical protein
VERYTGTWLDAKTIVLVSIQPSYHGKRSLSTRPRVRLGSRSEEMPVNLQPRSVKLDSFEGRAGCEDPADRPLGKGGQRAAGLGANAWFP